jgi:hypothetical protein
LHHFGTFSSLDAFAPPLARSQQLLLQAIFIGFSFFKEKNTSQGLQNEVSSGFLCV